MFTLHRAKKQNHSNVTRACFAVKDRRWTGMLDENNCSFCSLKISFKNKQGLNCCSTQAVSFHYTSGYKALELEYFLYHLKVAKKGGRWSYVRLASNKTSGIRVTFNTMSYVLLMILDLRGERVFYFTGHITTEIKIIIILDSSSILNISFILLF